jgi:hypothetical protein
MRTNVAVSYAYAVSSDGFRYNHRRQLLNLSFAIGLHFEAQRAPERRGAAAAEAVWLVCPRRGMALSFSGFRNVRNAVFMGAAAGVLATVPMILTMNAYSYFLSAKISKNTRKKITSIMGVPDDAVCWDLATIRDHLLFSVTSGSLYAALFSTGAIPR